MSESITPERQTLITPRGGSLRGYIVSLAGYRQLLVYLVWKDLKVQVADTVLGVGWLVLRPLLNALVLTAVFGRLARLPSEGQPYLLFLLTGATSSPSRASRPTA